MHTEDCACGGCGSDCGGDCGGDCGAMSIAITIDGEEVICNIIGTFEVAEMNYIALQPNSEDDIFFLRCKEIEGGLELDNIDSDEEYYAAAEGFYQLFSDVDDDDINCSEGGIIGID